MPNLELLNLAQRQKRILIIDDTRFSRELLEKVLGKDYGVLLADSPGTGLDLARSEQPDLILLDIVMPELDGYEVCRRLKADERTEDIPVIFVTQMDETEDEAKGLELGAVDYITKPVSPPLVKARVKVHLELKQHRDRLRKLVRIDSLTGLANRRRVDEYLDLEWLRARRSTSPLSVILIDIDQFYVTNDRFGRDAGDRCLIAVAEVLVHATARPADLVARFGGEEFIAVLPETELAGAIGVAAKMLEKVDAIQCVFGQQEPHQLTISLGVASGAPSWLDEVQEVLREAEENLYRAKQGGGHCVWPDAP